MNKKTGATRKIRNQPDNNPMDSPNELEGTHTPSQPSGPSAPADSSNEPEGTHTPSQPIGQSAPAASGWVIQLWQYSKKRNRGCPRKKEDGSDWWEPLVGESAAHVANLFGHRFPRYGLRHQFSKYDENQGEDIPYEYVHTGYMRGLQVNKKTGATRKIRHNPDNDPMDSPDELDYAPGSSALPPPPPPV